MRLKKNSLNWSIGKELIVFEQGNGRSHIYLLSRLKWRELAGKVLIHPMYSPNLAPSDYHLFRYLQNSNSVMMASKAACENHASVFHLDTSEVLHWRKYGLTRKVAKGMKKLLFEILINKFIIKNMKKTEIIYPQPNTFIEFIKKLKKN